jgi:uncharacterized RDD family membrane protein YckC
MTQQGPDERRPGADDETRIWSEGSQPPPGPAAATPPASADAVTPSPSLGSTAPPSPPPGAAPPVPAGGAPPAPPGPPAPAADPGSGGWGPASWSAVNIAPSSADRSVPGAPGLEYAAVAPRVVAFLLDGFVLVVLAVIIAAPVSVALGRLGAGTLIGSILVIVIDALYFAGLWSSGWRATVGMRLFRMQIGNAMDGRQLTLGQAVRRWIAFGTWLPALVIDPYLGGLASFALFAWWIVLLFTTASSPTRQGLHDRFAETAIVRPARAGGDGLLLGCVLLIVLLVLVSFVAIVALILLGTQVSTILSSVGDSI